VREAEPTAKRSVPPPGYTQIPNALFDEYLLECSGSEWQVLSMIARQTFGWGVEMRLLSTGQLAGLTGLSRQAVSGALTGLLKKGMVDRRHAKSNRWLYGIPVKKVDAAQKVGSPESRQPSTPGCQKSRQPLIRKENNKEKESASGGESVNKDDTGHIQELFDLWRSLTGRNGSTQLTAKRRSHLRARLADSSIDELRDAIRGLAGSRWHVEKGKTDFELIFRSRERVEFCLEKLKAPSSERVPLPGEANPRAAYDTTKRNPELAP
jgi:phage replication O-like protein O